MMVAFVDRSPSENLAWFARRRFAFALDRFQSRIADITLRVRDQNGPRGGPDQHCSVAIRVVGGPDLHIQDVDSSAEKAIHRLARRAARSIAQLARRHRSRRRGKSTDR